MARTVRSRVRWRQPGRPDCPRDKVYRPRHGRVALVSASSVGHCPAGDYRRHGGRAAEAAARKAPRILAGFPVVLTNDAVSTREAIGKALQIYGMVPSYRAMLDREGIA